METKRIVILGPESTGKTTLSRELAEHYGTKWVPEFARSFLLSHGMNYDYDDLLTIAKGQLAHEIETERAVLEDPENKHKLLFIDTNMYVMQVWCEFVFKKCHSWILEQTATRPYDLYLFCNIDLPWVQDQLREYPDLESRTRLYHIYKEILTSQDVPWIDISGENSHRLHVAIDAVDKCFHLD